MRITHADTRNTRTNSSRAPLVGERLTAVQVGTRRYAVDELGSLRAALEARTAARRLGLMLYDINGTPAAVRREHAPSAAKAPRDLYRVVAGEYAGSVYNARGFTGLAGCGYLTRIDGRPHGLTSAEAARHAEAVRALRDDGAKNKTEPTNGQPTNGQPTNGQPTNGQPTETAEALAPVHS